MATFDIQRSRISPSAQPGAAYANANVDTGMDAVSQAFAGLGQRIYQLGANKAEAENAIKKSELKLSYQTRTNEARQQLESTFDAAEQQKIIGQYQKDITGMQTGIPDVDNEFTAYRNSTLAENLSGFESVIHRNQLKSLNDKFEVEYQKTLQHGDKETANALIDSLVKAGAATPEKAQALKDAWFGDHVLTKAMNYINVGDEKSLGEAQKIITSMSDVYEKKPDEITTGQLAMLENARSALLTAGKRLQMQRQANSDEAQKQMTDLMSGNSLTLKDVKDRRDLLDPEDYNKWARYAMNPVKPGNNVAAATFKEMAMDVWRGSRSKQDVKKAMLTSLSEPDGISSEQYGQVLGFLDQRVKEVQAHAMKKASVDAARMILGKDSAAMTIDINGNVQFDMSKLGIGRQDAFAKKMDYIDRCNTAITQMVADNPDIGGKELYVRLNDIKNQYAEAQRSGKEPPDYQLTAPPPNPDPVNYPHAQYSQRYGTWLIPDPDNPGGYLEVR